MPLKPLPFREVKRRLELSGFHEAVQKGSHVKFAKQVDQTTLTTIVPRHKQFAIGTLRSILRQAGIAPSEFESL